MNILSQITELESFSLNQLMEKYKQVFGSDSGMQKNKAYLIRMISYKIQELAYGGISDNAKTDIQKFIKDHDPINKLIRTNKHKGGKNRSIKDRRLPIPGTTINKTYKDQNIEVKILEKGFEYNNKKYRSLSAIANEVTGTHINGYAFFEL